MLVTGGQEKIKAANTKSQKIWQSWACGGCKRAPFNPRKCSVLPDTCRKSSFFKKHPFSTQLSDIFLTYRVYHTPHLDQHLLFQFPAPDSRATSLEPGNELLRLRDLTRCWPRKKPTTRPIESRQTGLDVDWDGGVTCSHQKKKRKSQVAQWFLLKKKSEVYTRQAFY